MQDSPSYRVRTLPRPASVSLIRGNKQSKPSTPFVLRDVEQQVSGFKGVKSTGKITRILNSPATIGKPASAATLAQRIPKGFAIGSPSVTRVRRYPSQRITLGGLLPPSRAPIPKGDTAGDLILEDQQQSDAAKNILEKEEVETQISESRDQNTDSEHKYNMKTILNSELAVGQVFDTEVFKQNYLKIGSLRGPLTSCLKKREVRSGVLAKYLSESGVRTVNTKANGFGLPAKLVHKDQSAQPLTQNDRSSSKDCSQNNLSTSGAGGRTTKRVTFSENVIFFVFEQEAQ